MDWHDYLRQERQRKITTNDLMSSGRLTVRETRNGMIEDTTAAIITTNKGHIAEIEEILARANVPLEK